MTAIFALTFAAAAQAGGDTAPSGLPVPRFVSLKVDRVNVRGGPDKDHDVSWIYTRVGWPVEITAEFENWRRIRDFDGSEGWVYHSLLSGKRMAVGAAEIKDRSGAAACQARCRKRGAGPFAVRSARIGQALQRQLVPAHRRRLRRLDRTAAAVGRLSGREDRVTVPRHPRARQRRPSPESHRPQWLGTATPRSCCEVCGHGFGPRR